jgi:23S rRNA (uracil1939-C5)-methyltransferase
MIKGEDVVLTMEGLSGEGKAVARKDGMVYFVEGAVPGDVVQARIWKLKKNFAEAKAMAILEPSPSRVEPRCIHFGACGGCKWQNYAYAAQLAQKRTIVAEALHRIGGFADPPVRETIGCAEPWYYRNKMEFTFATSRWLTEEEMQRKEEIPAELALGLHVPKRYDKVVDIEECWLQSELSNGILRTVREVAKVWGLSVYSTETHTGYLRHLVIREAKHTGEVMVNLVTSSDWPEAMTNLANLLVKQFPAITTVVNNVTSRKSMVALGETETVYAGPGFIQERLGDFTFHISANSFFQTNTLQAEQLYNVVKDYAAVGAGDVLYDLYSGTGTIALYLSRDAERVIGIESVESSIRDAERNAELNRVINCYFLKGDLKDRLTTEREWLTEHPKPSVIVTDPPRNGMHEKVVEQIMRLKPARIVYVSCNPSTQARDAKLLAEGGYVLEKVQPVDMFPHTDHIETVALFTLPPAA